MTGRPTFEDFEVLGFRVGTVLRAEMNEGARDSAYKLWIDLGDEVPAQSSAKITDLYGLQDLVGRQVVVVTGFEPIRVGGFRSDVLVIGALSSSGVVLVEPDTQVTPGTVVG